MMGTAHRAHAPVAWCLAPAARAVLVVLAACTQGGGEDASPDDVAAPVGAGASGAGGAGGAGGASAEGAESSPTIDVPNLAALFEDSCATTVTEATLLPANLLFVLDRSASMACNPPPTTEPASCEANSVRADATEASKWEITTRVLLDAIAGLPPDTRVGVSYFSNDGGCGVRAEPTVPLTALAEGQLAAVRASLDNVQPEGSTPLVGATILAYGHLHQEALAGRVFGPRFVVVVTDGEQAEECGDPSRCDDAASCTVALLADVAKAAGPGVHIRTFVVGVPGSASARTTLSGIAEAGGTARPGCDATRGDCHFDVADASGVDAFKQALGDALQEIQVRAIACELPVPRTSGASFDPALVNVAYTPGDGSGAVLVVQDVGPCEGGANGWQYAPDGTRILLCGSACELAREDLAGRIDVVLGCETRRPR